MDLIKRHKGEFLRALEQREYDVTPGGIFFPKQHVMAAGVYFDSVNGGQDPREYKNLLPEQGLTSILNVFFGASSKFAAWYLALFSGAVTPTGSLTAANFAATQSEITSNTEGYSQTTRRQWVPTPATSPSIDNLASKAAFSIVCTSSININGAALLSDNVKGGTSGVLGSAARYPQTRVVYNGDNYELGYRVTLTG